MLQTFTQDDRVQEQYRLQEEWLRVQPALHSRIKYYLLSINFPFSTHNLFH
ncbi:hypothetical protein MHK_003420 [Candidatus Magnetomorum sp. HK-1]|nr:hypothetical protein MHK_003420 [Candidatus Magnetomorum sp. HK-1]